ncbi:unnamed protein product [Prorocentrum cordatum]|uniref:Uncharacterized protein n=1 Tax=Prorocentrum cordatum TaxID=2364126 RepID=A0ABN9TMH9_9DINO|nr:unnamed protein product [Polarella glacialis]
MATATALEMGFLGYSFACSLVKALRCRAFVPVLAVPPLAMVAASVAASAAAARLEHSPAFCGLIAFSLVALLFLVLQELLIEAHEKDGRMESGSVTRGFCRCLEAPSKNM